MDAITVYDLKTAFDTNSTLQAEKFTGCHTRKFRLSKLIGEVLLSSCELLLLSVVFHQTWIIPFNSQHLHGKHVSNHNKHMRRSHRLGLQSLGQRSDYRSAGKNSSESS